MAKHSHSKTNSENALTVTGANVVPLPQRPEPASPAARVATFVKEHPLLTTAGALAVGVALSAFLPRRVSRKASRHAMRLAEAGASAAALWGKTALDKAEDGGVIARQRGKVVANQAERLSELAANNAERLGALALTKATALGHDAIVRAERLGVRAERLGDHAASGVARLGDAALKQSSRLIGYPKRTFADRVIDKAKQLRSLVRA